MKVRLFFALFVSLMFIVASVSSQNDPITLTLVTHDSFSVSEDVLAQFQKDSGIVVEVLRAGDAGQLVNQSILSKSNPLGDVLYGLDNTFLSRALNADLFVPYESQLLSDIPQEFLLDSEFRVIPIDYGDVCINYDTSYFEDAKLALPESLADLTEPEYTGLLVVENPATSSPGLAFLLATVAEFGVEGEYGYLDFWNDLVDNEVLITDSWSDAYFGHFTAGSEDGRYPLVVSYASSPPFTVDNETGETTTGSIVADGMCFRQIEFVGILAGTDQLESAQQFVDFLLSISLQEDLPFQMFVFPVNESAVLPELFAEHALIPEHPATLTAEEIDAGREEWIEGWIETILR